MVWFKTDAGRNVPIDHSTVTKEDRRLDLARHTVHWNNCQGPSKDDIR